MQGVAQAWLVYRLTKSEFMLGATLFATHIPVLLLAPLGGLAVDRYSRRNVVFLTQSLAMLQAGGLAALTLTGKVNTTHVLLLAALLGVLNAFDIPGRQTLFIQMTGREDLISAISLNSAIFNFSRVLGPSLAGLIIAVVGEGICFAINATSFIVMLACLYGMHLPQRNSAGPRNQNGGLLDGFRYAWRARELAIVLGMSGLLNVAYAPVLALNPIFADGMFHKGSAGLGFFGGAMGVGAVIGVLHLARHRGINGLPDVMLWGALLMGSSLVVYAWSPWFYLSLLVLPLVGFSLMRQNAGGNSVIQSIVPDDYRGRLMALYSMMVTGLMPVSSLASGYLAEKFGARSIVFAAALLCLAGAIAFQRVRPAFQQWVDRHQEEVCIIP